MQLITLSLAKTAVKKAKQTHKNFSLIPGKTFKESFKFYPEMNLITFWYNDSENSTHMIKIG